MRWRGWVAAVAVGGVLCVHGLPVVADDAGGERLEIAAVETGLALPVDVAAIERPAAQTTGSEDVITLVLAGDIGLNGSDQPSRPEGALRHGRLIPFDDLADQIRPLMTGDLNFANLETVVTADNGIRPVEKLFNFRSHPYGVKALVAAGLNVVSTANNHAFDYGHNGARDTIRNLSLLTATGLRAAPGIGLTREDAARAWPVSIKSSTIAFAAAGIGGGGYGGRRDPGRPGLMAFGSAEDFADTLSRLSASTAQFRVLSVHYGQEMQVRPAGEDMRKLRDKAVREAGVDVVVGHHAHVPAGIQRVGAGLVLYGLGNFQHPGMRDLAGLGVCRDWGLMARLHLSRGDDGRLVTRAIEAIPLTNMHDGVTRMSADKAQLRIDVLNHHARGLDEETGARGVRFVAQDDGTGLACLEGADNLPGSIGAACRTVGEPSAVEPVRPVSCGDADVVARRERPAPPQRAPATGTAKPAPSTWANLLGFPSE